jgi:hypothetical protein
MSVFHRVDDIYAMPGPVFFKRAWRLLHYRGVMRARAIEAQDESQPARPAQTTAQASYAGNPDVREVPATKVALQNDPVFSGLISFG